MDYLKLTIDVLFWCFPILLYFLYRKLKTAGFYTYTGWYSILKPLYFKSKVEKTQKENQQSFQKVNEVKFETPRDLTSSEKLDSQVIYGIDSKGNAILVKISLKNTLHAEIFIEIRLDNGKIYRLPDENEIAIYSIASRLWKAQGLYIQVLEPFKRLRITYTGFLKNITQHSKDVDPVEHVQFNFIWTAASRPMHYPKDSDMNLIAKMMGDESECDSDLTNILYLENSYQQFGALQGFLKGSEYSDEVTFRLSSWRRRLWGVSESISTKQDDFIFGVCQDGTHFCIGVKNLDKSTTPFKYGNVLFSNLQCWPIKEHDLNSKQVQDGHFKRLSINFSAGPKKLKLSLDLNEHVTTNIHNKDKYGWKSTFLISEGYLDGLPSNIIVTNWEQQFGPGTSLPKPLLQETGIENAENILVCRLTDRACLDLSITGGKANSLALLSHIPSEEFMVPEGLAVTVTAFRKQLAAKIHLAKAVEKLENVCYGKIEGKIEDACKEISTLFSKEDVCEDVAKLVMLEIQKINASNVGNEMVDWRWAVRSSGIGEDSDELSAAGQNSTYLGCKDQDILKAISACWGSLFTFQSVQYRRQHGLSVYCEMAVVVQKMVPADCAGVLFSYHPATGDPSKMIITSNYGLGESVVSATADPDTITLSRSWDGRIGILESNVGTKKVQVTLDLAKNEMEGTSEKQIDPDLAKKLSLTEEQALKLGRLAVILEKEFGNPRDIEWSFYKNKLYLLQSRPITTLTTWTDYELLHEFDTPILSENNVYTRVNIGEVMKGAITVLTRSTILEYMDYKSQEEHFAPMHRNPYIMSMIPTVLHYGFIDILNFIYAKVPEKIDVGLRVMELSFLGRTLLDEKLHKEAIKRHGVQGRFKKSIQMLSILKKLWYSKSNLEYLRRMNKNWNITFHQNDTVLDMYKKIHNELNVIGDIVICYSNAIFASIFYQMFALNILTKRQAEFTEDHYHDIALILHTNTGVETLDMPITLGKIAKLIKDSGKDKEFLEINSANGLKWMKQNCREVGDIFANFLSDHGHRLFREYELDEDTWGENPAPLIEIIKLNCEKGITTNRAEGSTVEETISKLATPQSKLSKILLKFLITKLRESLILREKAKSHAIRNLGKFRTAYKQLASKMVSEGYLPQANLIYHLTLVELGDVIQKRDPVLLTKATRRKRLYPQWNKLQFSDICNGYPVPDRDGSEDYVVVRKSGESVKIVGTPVCTGTVVARACVIVDIKECDQIQSGDILITYSTDVGWTPYFPMLSGLVTEIGGLISHGAVVAREYGLPCIIGVPGATKMFKTGDKVLLSGKTGSMELLEE